MGKPDVAPEKENKLISDFLLIKCFLYILYIYYIYFNQLLFCQETAFLNSHVRTKIFFYSLCVCQSDCSSVAHSQLPWHCCWQKPPELGHSSLLWGPENRGFGEADTGSRSTGPHPSKSQMSLDLPGYSDSPHRRTCRQKTGMDTKRILELKFFF